MADNFNLRSFLIENKLTASAKYLSEQQSTNQLASAILDAIDQIGDASYIELASAVAAVLTDAYGEHNIQPFMKELHNQLNLNKKEI